MKVLKNRSQLVAARAELQHLGASSAESSLRGLLRQLRLVRGIRVGEFNKSWDVLETIKFLEANVSKADPILDIGSYASEIIVALHRLGFKDLSGADLNPNVVKMPFNDQIRFEVCDFMSTPFQDASFCAITSVSVIEHGFDGKRLMAEVSRLLRPGGYFVSSFDYWPQKIDTGDIKFFGMDWKIFSKQDVLAFIELANRFGLSPVGALDFDGEDPVIKCGGKDYTFGWLVLQKRS